LLFSNNIYRTLAHMISVALIMFVMPAILIAAAGWDIASFTIPNFIQGALLGAFAVFILTSGMTPHQAGLHIAAGVAGLGVGFALFSAGYVGGGDAKLFACVSLWFGLHDILGYALVASLFGGALTIGLIGMRKLPMPEFLTSQGWLMRLHDDHEGIPYGVALAAGAFFLLPQSEIFRIALGG
jgi:prepilin peptidase CpaA